MKNKPKEKIEPADIIMKDPTSLAALYQKAMHMRFNGAKYKDIGLAVGRKEQRVRCWFMRGGPLHDPFKEFCRKQLSVVPGLEVKSVAERIKEEAPKSLDTITDIRDSKSTNPATRYIAAKDILDRAGYGPVQKNANIHFVEEMSGEELNHTFLSFINAAKDRRAQKSQEGSPS